MHGTSLFVSERIKPITRPAVNAKSILKMPLWIKAKSIAETITANPLPPSMRSGIIFPLNRISSSTAGSIPAEKSSRSKPVILPLSESDEALLPAEINERRSEMRKLRAVQTAKPKMINNALFPAESLLSGKTVLFFGEWVIKTGTSIADRVITESLIKSGRAVTLPTKRSIVCTAAPSISESAAAMTAESISFLSLSILS